MIFCGGWTLLMRIVTNDTCHTLNAASGTTVLPTNTTCSKFSTTQINYILSNLGNKKITKIKPDNAVLLPFYQRSSSISDIWGSNLDCSNRANIPTWLLSSYKSLTDAINDTNKVTGNFTGAGHFYPTMYDTAQFFFLAVDSLNGAIGGIRANSAFMNNGFSPNQSATLWVKQY